MMVVELLTFINLFAVAIVVGGLVEVQFAEIPTFRLITPSEHIKIHQLLDLRMDRYMPQLTIISLLCSCVLLVLARDWNVRILFSFGILATLGVIFVSSRLNVPLNKKFRSWSKESPTSFAHRKYLEDWCRYHLYRTILGVLSLASFVLAVLAY